VAVSRAAEIKTKIFDQEPVMVDSYYSEIRGIYTTLVTPGSHPQHLRHALAGQDTWCQ
jgi:hypothetical protein